MADDSQAKKRLFFTHSWLKGIEGNGKRTEYADTKETALRLRVGPTGEGTFYAVVRVKGGTLLRKSLGDYSELGLADARKAAHDIRLQAGQGLDAREVERQQSEAKAAEERLKESRENFDLAGMLRWYIKDREENPERRLARKSALNYEALVRFYLDGPKGDAFRGRFAGDVPAFEIRDLLRTIATASPTQANRLFELIRAAYRLASYEGRVESVPALRRPAKNVSRERVLSQKEIQAFWRATETATLIPRKRPKPQNPVKAERARARAAESLKPLSSQARGALRMLLILGQRKSETLAMRWADIDASVWRIPGETRKGGRPHTVPLPTLAHDILDDLRPVTGGGKRVFEGISATNLHGRAFRAVREVVTKELKTPPFSIHDLRRTFATQSRELCGIRPDVLGDLLGHVSGKHASLATASYDKSTGLAEKASALEAWAATLRSITDGEARAIEPGKVLAFR